MLLRSNDRIGGTIKQKVLREVLLVNCVVENAKEFTLAANKLCDFFSMWVFFHEHSQFPGQQKGDAISFKSSLPLPPTSQTLTH